VDEGSDEIQVTRTVAIPRAEVEVRFTTSGGPGGQHANKTATRVDLRFDVEASGALTHAQKARIVERLGSPVRVVVDDERSQLRNRALAYERLAARLASALHVERPRRATRPSKGAKERRLQAKRQRSETKQQRRPPSHD
jgi:ribosome-associated protein